jgi:endoglucanase
MSAHAAARKKKAAAPTQASVASAPAVRCDLWPAWTAFKGQFVSTEGRVTQAIVPQPRTVSEAQGYAMFFALVANDTDTFERILRWTEDNLAGGDLTARLPAWQWGKRDDGSYGVIDDNPASDADLWIAFALGEAGRLWNERRYVALASLVAARVVRNETAELPGLGLTLLPGPHGFKPAPDTWRLNPSYIPLPLMRWFASRAGAGPWEAMLNSSLRALRDSAPKGFAPEWTLFHADKNSGAFDIASQPAADRSGGYNAIRVYLWLGMTSPQDPARADMLARLAPMADLIEKNGMPPESVDAVTGAAQGSGPTGFSAAVLPFLAALKRDIALRQQALRLQARPPRADAYYEQALTLFGQGWHEGRFRFGPDGSLLPNWKPCEAKPHTPSR